MHSYTTISITNSNNNNGCNCSFQIGCQVLARRSSKRGVIVAEKAGGWRIIRFPDSTFARHRPSELKSFCVQCGSGRANININGITNMNMSYTGFNGMNNISSSTSAFQPCNNNSNNINMNHMNNMSNTIGTSLPHYGLTHSYNGFANKGLPLDSMQQEQQQLQVRDPKWLHNLSKVFVFQDEQQRKLEQLERVSFRVGDNVKVKKTGKIGTIITEKSGGWRVIRFSDRSSAAFRPSALIEIKSTEKNVQPITSKINEHDSTINHNVITDSSMSNAKESTSNVTNTDDIRTTDGLNNGSIKQSVDNISSESITSNATSNNNNNNNDHCNNNNNNDHCNNNNNNNNNREGVERREEDDGCDFMIGMDSLDHFYNPSAVKTITTNTITKSKNSNSNSDTQSVIYSEVSETTDDQDRSDRSLSLSCSNSNIKNSCIGLTSNLPPLYSNSGSGFKSQSVVAPATTIGSTTTVTLTMSINDDSHVNNLKNSNSDAHLDGSNNKLQDSTDVPNIVYI